MKTEILFVIITIVWVVGFQASVPDCMKPDTVSGEKKASKKSKKKAKKKSSASYDADWVPELEEVSYSTELTSSKWGSNT